jgi:hypothetical protein
MIAEPSSPSRVRYAAPNTRRALDCSGRLCKTSPLWKKGGSQKGKGKNKVKITLCLTSTGILMEGDYTTLRFSFAFLGDFECNRDFTPKITELDLPCPQRVGPPPFES